MVKSVYVKMQKSNEINHHAVLFMRNAEPEIAVFPKSTAAKLRKRRIRDNGKLVPPMASHLYAHRRTIAHRVFLYWPGGAQTPAQGIAKLPLPKKHYKRT